jgi:hypothetical protein
MKQLPMTGDEAFNKAWEIFVGLKRSLDETDDGKNLVLSKDDWANAVDAMHDALSRLELNHRTFTP